MPSSVVVVLVVIKHRINTSKIQINNMTVSYDFFSFRSDTYQSTRAFDTPPTAFDNKIHVSEIYGISTYTELLIFQVKLIDR